MSAPGLNALQTFYGQCVGFVRQVLPWIPGGPDYAAQYPGTLTGLGYTKLTQAANAAAGDVLIIPANYGKSTGVAGHIAVVTSADSMGNLTVAQANWGPGAPNGTGPSLMRIPYDAVNAFAKRGGGVFAPPASLASESTGRAMLAVDAIQSSSHPAYYSFTGGALPGTIDPAHGAAALGKDITSSATGIPQNAPTNDSACQPLGTILSQSGASSVLGGIPLIGGFWTAATFPEKMVQWAIQPCVRWRIAFGVGALVLVWYGVHFATRQEAPGVPQVPSPGQAVSRVGKTAAKAAAA